MTEFNSIKWKSSTVLITGCTGFIGGVLANFLVNKGARVFGLVRALDQNNELTLNNSIHLLQGDVTDARKIIEHVTFIKPDFIFHLAGEAIQASDKTYGSNVEGTVNLVDAIRDVSPETKLIFASSDSVYGKGRAQPFDEETIPSPISDYACSKLEAERYIVEQSEKHQLKMSIARLSNVYGGQDRNFTHLIPGQIKRVLNNEPPVLNSDGKAVCDFIYIDDIVNGLVSIAEAMTVQPRAVEIFNLSTETSTQIINVVEFILKYLNKSSLTPLLNLSANEPDVLKKVLAEKSRSVLGWQAEFKLEDGLRKTIEHYREILQ